MSKKGIAVRQYSLTALGKEAFPIVGEFDNRVTEAFRDYKSQMTALADKYGISEKKRNGFMGTMLNAWASELFGFSHDIY